MIFFFILSVFSHKYFIKLRHTEQYLRGVKGGTSPPFFDAIEHRNRFTIKTSPDSKFKRIIYAYDFPNQVLDLSEDTNKLILYPFYGTKNQDVVLRMENGKNLFRIVMNDKCLTWHPDLYYLEGQVCAKDNENQRFEIICADCRGKSKSDDDPKHDESKGFYSEKVMSTLEKIKNMANDIKDCFANNRTCDEPKTEKPILCLSPFDTPLSLSKPILVDNVSRDQNGDPIENEDLSDSDIDSESQVLDNGEADVGGLVTGGNGKYNADLSAKYRAGLGVLAEYGAHDEMILHDEELERKMEAEFNYESIKLEMLLRRYLKSSFKEHANAEIKHTNEDNINTSANSSTASLSAALVAEIQKLHALPTYSDLFKIEDSRNKDQERLESEKKMESQIHADAENLLSDFIKKLKEKEKEVLHKDCMHDEKKYEENNEDPVGKKTETEKAHLKEKNYDKLHESDADKVKIDNVNLKPEDDKKPNKEELTAKLNEQLDALKSSSALDGKLPDVKQLIDSLMDIKSSLGNSPVDKINTNDPTKNKKSILPTNLGSPLPLKFSSNSASGSMSGSMSGSASGSMSGSMSGFMSGSKSMSGSGSMSGSKSMSGSGSMSGSLLAKKISSS